MKRYIIILLFIIHSFAGTAKDNDSIYFSVKSLCNIRVEFLGKKQANAMINGKKHNGNIVADKNSKGYYNFIEKGTSVFMFLFEDDKLFIVNQQYQFDCESAKIIELSKLTDDTQVIKYFNDYTDFNASLWDNIGAVNDKGYYLGEMKYYNASVSILEQVVTKNPDRAVAWLNLGDSLWGIDKKTEAQEAYTKYMQLIKNQNKDQKKIPQRVYDRINNKK